MFQNDSKEHEAINSFLEPKELFFLPSVFKKTRDAIGDQKYKTRC
jgi:hypothetical protein